MQLTDEKRKKIKELVLGTISRLEVGDENTKRYEAFFKSMTDEEFDTWANSFEKDTFDKCIQIFVKPFEEPSLKNIETAAEYLGMPIDEYVYYNDQYLPDGTKAEPVRTKVRMPVGYVHIRRVQQLLSRKNHYGIDVEQRNLKTGDVTGHSKVASVSDVEAVGLLGINANECLKEFMTFRSDNELAKSEAYLSIARNGYIAMKDLTINTSKTKETISKYLFASGIKNDFLGSTLKLPYTIESELQNKK